MALPTAAPTMAPPRIPAPTAQPKQRASALEGVMNADAMIAAAASDAQVLVIVLVIQSLSDEWNGTNRAPPAVPVWRNPWCGILRNLWQARGPAHRPDAAPARRAPCRSSRMSGRPRGRSGIDSASASAY